MASVFNNTSSSVANLKTASRTQSDVDPYLTEGIPLLGTCWKLLQDITGLKLNVEQKLSEWIFLALQQWQNIDTFVSVLSSGSSVRTVEEALSFLALESAYNHQLSTVIDKNDKSTPKPQDENSSVVETVSELAQLKTSLEKLTAVVDKIMDFYTGQSLGFAVAARPSVDDLKKMKKEICDLKSSIKEHSLLNEQYQGLETTEENIMCDILGMTEDFGRYLYDLDFPVRIHQTDFYFLEKFIENRENDMCAEGTVDWTPGKNGLLKNLEKLGFTTERASSICETIPDDFIDLESPSFWALRYLDHAYSRHPLFSSAPRYPYQEGNTDEFFEHNVPTEGRPEPETSSAHGKSEWSVNILNVSELSRQDITSKISELMNEDGGANRCKLFYHGTKHECAKSILESGIKLRLGKLGQDFSSGGGFYVSEKYKNAEKWSRAGRGGNPQAVVVFKIQESLLSEGNGKDLTPEECRREWGDIIKECRKDYPDKDLEELLSKVSFIKGPMCSNPRQVVQENHEPEGFGSGNIQLCVREKTYAKKFGAIENICCVIFY